MVFPPPLLLHRVTCLPACEQPACTLSWLTCRTTVSIHRPMGKAAAPCSDYRRDSRFTRLWSLLDDISKGGDMSPWCMHCMAHASRGCFDADIIPYRYQTLVIEPLTRLLVGLCQYNSKDLYSGTRIGVKTPSRQSLRSTSTTNFFCSLGFFSIYARALISGSATISMGPPSLSP